MEEEEEENVGEMNTIDRRGGRLYLLALSLWKSHFLSETLVRFR